MPLNAVGWSTEEDEELITLVKPHPFLYDIQDPSRNNLITRENSWKQIAKKIGKPVEECRKRWRGLRDGYMRRKRVGSKGTSGIIDRLSFLDVVGKEMDYRFESVMVESNDEISHEPQTEEVITDGYYEITMMDTPQDSTRKQPQLIKILPKRENMDHETDRVKRQKTGGRKKAITLNTASITPVKILPKPFVVTSENLKNLPVISYQSVEDKTQKTSQPIPSVQQNKPQMEQLLEKILQESTNEVDIFFKSMSASVKKLSPSLIPKIKMEVCNVIAKYEMQNYEQFKK